MELARRCGVRARRVRLIRRRWWRHGDYGPMLAFLDGAPVALLPGWTGYRVVKGKTNKPLRETEAARLGKHMYVFSAPYESSRSGTDLLRRSAGTRHWELMRAALWACASAGAASMLPVLAYRAIAGGVRGTGLIPAALASCAAVVLFDLAFNAGCLRLASHLQIDISSSLVERLLRLPAEYFRRNSAEVLGYRLAGASLALDSGVGGQLAGLFALPYCLAGLLLTAMVTPGTGMIAAVSVIVLALAPTLAMRRELELEPERAGLHATHGQFLANALHGFARLRVLSSEGRIVDRWQRLWSAERFLALRQHRTRMLPSALESGCLTALVLFAIGVSHASCSLPVLVAGALAFIQCVFGAMMVGEGLCAALKVRFLLRPLDSFLAEPYEPVRPELRPRSASGAMDIRSVDFHYSNAHSCALEEISLALRPGEMLAITGPSGSGKSTLLRILAGLEKPQKGEVLYDGSSLEDWDPNALRAQFGVVLQEDSLAVSTARYNIASFGEYQLDEVWAAARMAVVDGDLERMPMGIQTIIEDERVSTGQKQRILLASRLLRRPHLLFLDEAASALDAEIQLRVLANIRALGITCVCVTHRASTIALADRVAMLERGRLAWTGPVEEWLARYPLLEMPPGSDNSIHQDEAAAPVGLQRQAAERRVFRAYALNEFHAPVGVGAPAYLLAPGYGLAAAGIAFLSFAAVRTLLFLF
ncbi:MAG: ATP-binding cassette domain-containing protein [Terracidiphilus sp.]